MDDSFDLVDVHDVLDRFVRIVDVGFLFRGGRKSVRVRGDVSGLGSVEFVSDNSYLVDQLSGFSDDDLPVTLKLSHVLSDDDSDFW